MSGASSTFSAPVQVAGDKVWLGETVSSDALEVSSLLDFIVDADKVKRLYRVIIDSRVSLRVLIKKNLELIGSMRTSAASPFEVFDFTNGYDLIEGDEFHVELDIAADQAISDIAVYAQLSELDA